MLILSIGLIVSSVLALTFAVLYFILRRKLKYMGKRVIVVDNRLDDVLERLSREYRVDKGDLVYTSTVLMRNALDSDSVSLTRGGESVAVNVSAGHGKLDFSIKAAKK